MTRLEPPFRPARPEDAARLAELVDYASQGLAPYLWGQMAPSGEDPWEFAMDRAMREEGSFSYRNAIMIEQDGAAAGCLISYEIADRPDPIPDDMPAILRPLQELENMAAGTWYVNVLAVVPRHRGGGLGSALLGLAEELARAGGKRGMSLITSDSNPDARRLYERRGFREAARRPMVKEGWVNDGETWILMMKDL